MPILIATTVLRPFWTTTVDDADCAPADFRYIHLPINMN